MELWSEFQRKGSEKKDRVGLGLDQLPSILKGWSMGGRGEFGDEEGVEEFLQVCSSIGSRVGS